MLVTFKMSASAVPNMTIVLPIFVVVVYDCIRLTYFPQSDIEVLPVPPGLAFHISLQVPVTEVHRGIARVVHKETLQNTGNTEN